MTLISLKKLKNNFASLCALCVVLVLLFPVVSFAQSSSNGLSLSVTPTLFEMSASPSQVWNSSVKVINNNPHELTVYASVVNFAPKGESGEGKFVPVFEDVTEGSTLAEWITITSDPVVIPAEQSAAIPVSVQVPADATPGGHFAAILVGTRPIDTEDSIQVRTSQLVTSLFFVRIAGDVTEEGTIREFRTTRAFVDSPQADFEVRFENKGNVHLQPQGEIVITNMWGKERGIIPINHQTHFGNVLPESIRKFEFTWKGEQSFSDIGRYKAALTLGYGEEGKNFVTSTTYFYVVPFKALAIVIGSLALFIFCVSFMIKAYVRRMLLLAGVEPSMQRQPASFVREGDVRIVKNVSLKAPMQSGVRDLKARMKNRSTIADKLKSLGGFVSAYRIFFGSVVVLLIGITAGVYFFMDVTTNQRDYEVVIENPDSAVTLSSEEILSEKANPAATQPETFQATEQTYDLVLVNSSDTPGLAAELEQSLAEQGYTVSDLQSDFEKSKERTVIVYDTELQEAALALSKLLDGALLSARTTPDEDGMNITVYIGNDYASQ